MRRKCIWNISSKFEHLVKKVLSLSIQFSFDKLTTWKSGWFGGCKQSILWLIRINPHSKVELIICLKGVLDKGVYRWIAIGQLFKECWYLSWLEVDDQDLSRQIPRAFVVEFSARKLAAGGYSAPQLLSFGSVVFGHAHPRGKKW